MKKISQKGRHVSMVDVSAKPVQRRTARATGRIELKNSTVSAIRDNRVGKGDVISAAQIAGIQAAKRTAELIPLCHPIQIGKIEVALEVDERGIKVTSEVVSVNRTGVEMEALTAVSVALLTVYDMCKAVDKTMKIGEITLLEKKKEDTR